MKGTYRIFDTHTHLGTARHSGRRYSEKELLRDMDRHGVDRSMVIPFPVVEDYRSQHDLVGKAVRNHSDRLTGAACLYPLIETAKFRDEVRRSREVYGFTAVKLQPQYLGLNPFSNSSDFLFESALENGMSVICHTGSGLPFAAPSLCMMPARKFPDLKIVVAHCGGGIFVHEAILAAVFCPNIFLEMSTLMEYHVLEVLQHIPSNRLMIGSDLPVSVETEIGKVLNLDISDGDKRNILNQTACGLFGSAC